MVLLANSALFPNQFYFPILYSLQPQKISALKDSYIQVFLLENLKEGN